MARRKPYTKLTKEGQVRPPHVQGMGDVLFKGFQCISPGCIEYILVRSDQIPPDFRILCPSCGFELASGLETKLFDYGLVRTDMNEVIEQGEFVILHDDYLSEAALYKYCLLCYALKPVELFDRHASRRSGYQSECRLCKAFYNGIKNQSRIADQHREAAQRRRLYRQLTSEAGRIDSRVVFDRFKGECFNCGQKLNYTKRGQRDFNLDHTLPVRLLWPLTTLNATLLCKACNNAKHDQWPCDFYSKAKLKSLAHLTGYEFALLAGPPRLNEASVVAILEDVDGFIEEWIHCPRDIRKVRSLIRELGNIDIFAQARHVPNHLREPGE